MGGHVVLTASGRSTGEEPRRGRPGGLRQTLFTWRGVPVPSYPVVSYLGLTLGVVAGDWAANVAGLNSVRVVLALMVLAVPGLIGARLLFVASNWALYRREPKRIWRRSDSGGAMQGGFVLAVATSPAVLAVIGLPFGAFWDVATFAMLVWLIIGKLGCALHGCCSGRPSVGPISLPLRDSHGIKCRRIPSQFLEAGFAVVLLVGAAALWHGAPFPGALFLSTGVAYGTGRFFLQPLRHEHIHAGNVDIQRAVSAALTVVSLAALLVLSLAPDSGS